MAKFTAHFYPSHELARRAFFESELPGLKRATSLRISELDDEHLFAGLASPLDAERLAGHEFTAAEFAEGIPDELRQLVLPLIRQPG